MTTKIVIAGAPHSGKSVFIEGLSESLGNQVAFVFRACPDGEGHWTYKGTDSNGVESSSLRRKGQFTNEVVDWYAQSLKEMNLSPIVLVDIGGRTSLENRKVIVDGEISHYILLYSKEEQKEEWELWLDSLKLKKVASIKSDYNAPEDIVSEDGRYSIHHLERGEQGISDRPVIKKITEIILTLIMDQGKGGNMNSQKITLAEIAKEIGKEEEEKTLPNGKVVKTINWKGEDLVAIARLFHNKSSELPEGVDFDGPGPAWLYAALVHEIHPREARVNSPDGMVAIGCQKPYGSGEGVNLQFKKETKEDWTWITCEQADPSIPLSPKDLESVVPPEIEMGEKVVISGRMPIWLVVSLAMAYHGKAKAVALYQPGVGSTIAWTHSQECGAGSINLTKRDSSFGWVPRKGKK